jgi:hypothetical protein
MVIRREVTGSRRIGTAAEARADLPPVRFEGSEIHYAVKFRRRPRPRSENTCPGAPVVDRCRTMRRYASKSRKPAEMKSGSKANAVVTRRRLITRKLM